MMKEKEKEKREKLRKILPLAWNSYQHMYNTRAKNIENQINFLLIIVSFLPIISLILFQKFDNPIFLVPILPQFIALIFLLKPFFMKNWPIVNWMPWEWVKESILKNQFDQELFASLKGLENVTWTFQGIMKNLIKTSVYLLLLSLYGIILAVLSEYLQLQFYSYLLIFILGILLVSVLIFYEKQPDLMKKAISEIEEFKKQIEDWIKSKD